MARDGSDLCLKCGLCCRGILHGHVILRDGEAAQAVHHSLDVFEVDGRQSFALPCPHLEGTACQVYRARPDACARYRCGMLDDYLDGEISLEEGTARIAEVGRLLAQVRSVADPAMTIPEIRQRWRRGLSDFLTGDPATADRERLAFLHMTALCRYLDRNILSPFEPSIMRDVDQPLEPSPDPS